MVDNVELRITRRDVHRSKLGVSRQTTVL